LHRKLQESLGADAGEELASVMDRIDPIRGDIAELRQVMERLEAKLDAGFAASAKVVDAALAKSATEQTRFLFLAWAVLLAAIVGLYAR
jgi:hypothetical protein